MRNKVIAEAYSYLVVAVVILETVHDDSACHFFQLCHAHDAAEAPALLKSGPSAPAVKNSLVKFKYRKKYGMDTRNEVKLSTKLIY